MALKFNALDVFIKTAAVSGIGLVWINFTLKAFKMACHIISTSPEEDTLKPITKQIVMCEKCQEHFIDDGEELKFGKFLCESCRNYELKK